MSRLVYGFHAITTCIRSNASKVEIIYVNNKRVDKRQKLLLELATQHKIKVELVDENKLNSLVATGQNHQGVIAKAAKQQQQTLEELLDTVKNLSSVIILILDGITDPQNLGAIIRTADCFGVNGIIIPKDNSANSSNETVAKVSSGAIDNIPLITVNNLNTAIDKLKAREFWVAGTILSNTAVNLFEFKPASKIVWVMGNEGTGIRRLIKENCDYHVTIPMFGQTQSLNVSVATGVVLSHTRNLLG